MSGEAFALTESEASILIGGNMQQRNGRRPFSLNEHLLAEVILRQMELMQQSQRITRQSRWDDLLQRFIVAAGLFVAGIGIGRLIG